MNIDNKLAEYKGLLARKENFGNPVVDSFIDDMAQNVISSSEEILENGSATADLERSDLESIGTELSYEKFENNVEDNVENIINSDIDLNMTKNKIKELLGVYILTRLSYKDDVSMGSIIDNLKERYQNKINGILDELESDLEDTIKTSSESFTFPMPTVVRTGKENFMSSMGIQVASGEGFFDTLEMVSGVAGLIEMMVAIPITTAMMVKNLKSPTLKNSTIKFPLIASDSISDTVVSKIAKSYEVNAALEIKALLEALASRFDSGNITGRIGELPFFNPNSKDLKDNDITKKMSYEEVLGIFSESFFVRDLYKSEIIMAEAMTHTFKNKGQSLLVDQPIEVKVMGENGTFIQSGRDALPTYIEMELIYNEFKSPTKLDTVQKSKRISIGVQVTPRTVSSFDIIETLNDMSSDLFNNVVQTNEERNFVKKLKNVFRFYKQKGTNEEKKILKSNSFSDIVNKIEKIKSPLFHLVISMDEYRELKEMYKIDLMNKSTYSKVMGKLPIISFSIVDLDTDFIYISESNTMNFVKRNLEDLANAMTQHEKELKAFVKAQKYM